MGRDAVPVLVRGLTKRLRGGVLALDGLDLTVEEGQIVGLAGPNGAGKSITLKVLLGLVRPSAGRVELFGQPVHPGTKVLARVGALVDGPGFVPHLSGFDNLRLAWRLTKRPEAEADFARALDIAGLGSSIYRRYRTYSHGMRYRLGLAQALLGCPDLLILDEPATGLDPAHIHEVRRAIKAAAAHGSTVLLSSHQLSEVEQLCTHTAVVRRGRLVASGPVAGLVGPAGAVALDVAQPAEARRLLALLPAVTEVSDTDTGALIVQGDGVRPVELLVELAEAGVEVRAFRRGRSLEDAYLALVGGDAPVEEAGAPGRWATRRQPAPVRRQEITEDEGGRRRR
jgi:ABC-2 type transport system ATP-binding protein